LKILRDECAAVGRDPSEIELTVHDRNTEPDALSAGIEGFAKAGVSRVLVSKLPADELQNLVTVLADRFGIAAA
jgi:hypothetical protein